jgi:hypothetical protein
MMETLAARRLRGHAGFDLVPGVTAGTSDQPAVRFCSSATDSMKMRPSARGTSARNAARRRSSNGRENPLAHRHRREDAVDDAGGGVGHATPGAARADAPTLAREGDEKIAVTGASVEAEESVGEHAAREVGTEGLFDVTRQNAFVALARVCKERVEVIADERVEDCLRRTARSVVVLGRARSPRRVASRQGAGDLAIAVPRAA